MRLRIGCFTLGLATLLNPALHAQDPWQAGLALDAAGAVQALEERLESAPASDQRTRLALASALLLKQPRSIANLRRALALCEVAVSAPDLPVDEAVLARYLRARLNHAHLEPADLPAARADYNDLVARFPTHPLAGHAAVKLAILELFEAPSADPAAGPRLVEQLLVTITSADARRELHFQLGRFAWLRHADAPTALRHLRAARELDFQQIDRNAEVDLMIAGIAREHDQPELALAHYQRFLANKIRDARVTTVQEIVAALTAELASDPRS